MYLQFPCEGLQHRRSAEFRMREWEKGVGWGGGRGREGDPHLRCDELLQPCLLVEDGCRRVRDTERLSFGVKTGGHVAFGRTLALLDRVLHHSINVERDCNG